MKLLRPATCLVLAASLAAAGTAAAATKPKPKPVCNLITDVAGDSSLTTAQTLPPSEAGLDIVGGDIAGTAKILTGVIRLSSVDAPSSAPFGYGMLLYFRAPDSATDLYFRYANDPLNGVTSEFGFDDEVNGLTPLGDAAAIVDAKKKEIRLTAPTKGFADHGTIKAGTKLSGLSARTSRDGVAVILYADEATGSKSYAVGQASCVTPGK